MASRFLTYLIIFLSFILLNIIIIETLIDLHKNILSNHFFNAFFQPLFPVEFNIFPAPS